MKLMKEANDKYGLDIQLSIDLDNIVKELAKSIQKAREKISENSLPSTTNENVIINDEFRQVIDHGDGIFTTRLY